MGQGRARRRAQRWDEGEALAPGGRYAQSGGADGRGLPLGARAAMRRAGREGQRGRMTRDCARRSRGEGRLVAAQRRKVGGSSKVWPCSFVFLERERLQRTTSVS